MVVEDARERETQPGCYIVESPRTSFIYWFTNDSQVRLPVLPDVFRRLTNAIALFGWVIEGSI